MDLQRAWKKLETERLEKPFDTPLSRHPKWLHSKHPAIKLQQGLKISLGFAVIFFVVFIGLFLRYDPWLIKLFIAIVLGSFSFFGIANYLTLQRVNRELNRALTDPLKESLERIHNIIYRSMRFQEIGAIFLYPFSAIAGYMMALGELDNFDDKIQQTKFLLPMIIAAIVCIPLCYWLTRWMYKVSYETYMDQLKVLIRDMETEG